MWRGCPSTGHLRWTSGGRDICRIQCTRRTRFCTLRFGCGLNGKSNNFKNLWIFILITNECGKGNLTMNTMGSRPRRGGGTSGGPEDWNKKSTGCWAWYRCRGFGNYTLSVDFPLLLKFQAVMRIWAFKTITVDAMWWRLARRTMCLLAAGYTNCLRHTVILSMSIPLTLKTAQGIWNILPHSKFEKSKTNTIWKGRSIKRQNKTTRWNKITIDFLAYPGDDNHTLGLKETLLPRIQKRSLHVWQHTYKGLRWCGLPPLPGGRLYTINTQSWRFGHRSDLLTEWYHSSVDLRTELPQSVVADRERNDRHLTFFKVSPSSVQDMSRNLGLLGKPNWKTV